MLFWYHTLYIYPARGEILSEPERRFTAQSPSYSPYSPFHCPDMTEMRLNGWKGRKTLHHPSIHRYIESYSFIEKPNILIGLI